MKVKHTHKYQRETLGKDYIIYKCVLPGCTHYLPLPLIVGKVSICWNCGMEFIIRKGKNGINKKPKCENCVNHKSKNEENAILNLLKENLT